MAVCLKWLHKLDENRHSSVKLVIMVHGWSYFISGLKNWRVEELYTHPTGTRGCFCFWMCWSQGQLCFLEGEWAPLDPIVCHLIFIPVMIGRHKQCIAILPARILQAMFQFNLKFDAMCLNDLKCTWTNQKYCPLYIDITVLWPHVFRKRFKFYSRIKHEDITPFICNSSGSMPHFW